MDERSYYLIKKIDKDMSYNGISIPSGFYRVDYNLSGTQVEHACQYSKDRIHWEDTTLYKNISEFRDIFDSVKDGMVFYMEVEMRKFEKISLEQFKEDIFDDVEDGMVFEKMEYLETVKYKNQLVPVFIDDYGQCFYAIYKNREIVFGAYQDNYEDEIKYLIDRD